MSQAKELNMQDLTKACAEAPLFGMNGKALILQAAQKAMQEEEELKLKGKVQQSNSQNKQANINKDIPNRSDQAKHVYKGDELYGYVQEKARPMVEFLIKSNVARNIRQNVLNKFGGKFLAILAQELQIQPNRIKRIIQVRNDFKKCAFQAAVKVEKELYAEVENKQVYMNLASRTPVGVDQLDPQELNRLKQVYRVGQQSNASKPQQSESQIQIQNAAPQVAVKSLYPDQTKERQNNMVGDNQKGILLDGTSQRNTSKALILDDEIDWDAMQPETDANNHILKENDNQQFEDDSVADLLDSPKSNSQNADTDIVTNKIVIEQIGLRQNDSKRKLSGEMSIDKQKLKQQKPATISLSNVTSNREFSKLINNQQAETDINDKDKISNKITETGCLTDLDQKANQDGKNEQIVCNEVKEAPHIVPNLNDSYQPGASFQQFKQSQERKRKHRSDTYFKNSNQKQQDQFQHIIDWQLSDGTMTNTEGDTPAQQAQLWKEQKLEFVNLPGNQSQEVKQEKLIEDHLDQNHIRSSLQGNIDDLGSSIDTELDDWLKYSLPGHDLETRAQLTSKSLKDHSYKQDKEFLYLQNQKTEKKQQGKQQSKQIKQQQRQQSQQIQQPDQQQNQQLWSECFSQEPCSEPKVIINDQQIEQVKYSIKKFAKKLLDPILESDQISFDTYKLIIRKVSDKIIQKAGSNLDVNYIDQNKDRVISLVYKYIQHYMRASKRNK